MLEYLTIPNQHRLYTVQFVLITLNQEVNPE